MGCRDCNNDLEACQNSLARATEKAERAIVALSEVGGLLDEYDDEVSAVIRQNDLSQEAKETAVLTVAAEKMAIIFVKVEQWLRHEEK